MKRLSAKDLSILETLVGASILRLDTTHILECCEKTSRLYSDYWEMLYQAVKRLPKSIKVVVLADRGFVHTDCLQAMSHQLRWHYRVRLKRDSWIWRNGKGWCQLKDFHLKRGEALCFHQVKLHKGQGVGPLGYNAINGEFWAIVSDEPTALHTFEEYGRRFDIEENFLDDQSNGFKVQKLFRTELSPLFANHSDSFYETS